MAVAPGQRLGPYEIVAAIGKGGMARSPGARTRLERTVQSRFCPTAWPEQSDLRDRFEREARTIASLNHPHICVLHDIGHDNSTHYLVMEYPGRRHARAAAEQRAASARASPVLRDRDSLVQNWISELEGSRPARKKLKAANGSPGIHLRKPDVGAATVGGRDRNPVVDRRCKREGGHHDRPPRLASAGHRSGDGSCSGGPRKGLRAATG